MKFSIPPVMLVLAIAAPSALAADDTYRSTMPNGQVIYSDSPQPGAREVRKIPPPPAATGTIVATPEEKARSPAIDPPPGSGAVVVVPQSPRPPTRELEQGRTTPRGTMPQRY